MKRIDPLGATLEACVTRCGTVVGPLLTEIVGHPELTPYRGGWAGNEVFSGAFSEAARGQARDVRREARRRSCSPRAIAATSTSTS